MDITKAQREERFEKAPPTVRALYDSEESGVYLFAVFQKHQLPEEKYREYAIAIGNAILGFYPLWQLPELLEQALSISSAQAAQIADDLQPFFAPIIMGVPNLSPVPPSEQHLPQQSAPPPAWQHRVENPAPSPQPRSSPLPQYTPYPHPPAPQPSYAPVQPPASPPPHHVAPPPPREPLMPPPAIPTPQTVPSYQKPLTQTPPYRNADLYTKP